MLCVAIPSAPAAADGTDLVEFERLADATAFGWRPLEGTRVTAIRDGKVGQYALHIEAGPSAEPYRGIDLLHPLNLAGAEAGDTIAFHVKQNYGASMRIQVWTEGGPLHRSFPVKHATWTRVELDLDLALWENPKGAAWGRISRIQFYEQPFMKEGQYMTIDGLTASAGGKPVSPTPIEHMETWTFPHETGTAWHIANEDAAWAVSKTTGQVAGGWNVKTKERYLVSLEGRYHLEDRESLVTGAESRDEVLSATFDEQQQRIELTCSNPTVPDLVIRKRYWIRENKLFQRVGLTTRSSELQFVTYNSQATFDQAYRDAGYYMGGGDGGWPLVPVPNISTWQKITSYRNTTKGMVLHQPEKGYSFAHIRTRLDDQFVWPWFTGAIASYCLPKNMMHYTPNGWDMSLGTSKLSPTRETSYEQYTSVFKGDWQRFLTHEYPALPEVQDAYREIPPTPDWVASIKISAGSELERLRRMVAMTDEGYIMALVDLGGSWADYYVDQSIAGGLGGHIKAEELKDLIERIHALSPRIKVGIYMWVLSTTENTRIYREHPEWFRTRSKEGDKLNTFPGLATNYAHLLSIPECYDELLSQFDLVLGYLGTDFIYLDDPKAINPVDWESGEYTRDDISFRMFLDIKRIAARHGPDKMVFFNNMCNPYADINFIEGRGELGAGYWRHFAGNVAIAETFLNAQPDARIVPLYYVTPHEREYVNRVLAMGWIPSLVYGDVIARRAFIQAAYEIGNCSTVPLRYSPDWKRDKKTHIESYAVQRRDDDGYMVSFISHEEKSKSVPVELDLGSYNPDREGQVFVWQYVVENANEYKGIGTEDLVRNMYTDTGWQIDRVTRRKLVYAGPFRDTLALDITMEPLLLYQLTVSTQPFGVYSENRLPANYLFSTQPAVRFSGRVAEKDGLRSIEIDSDRDVAEVISFLPLSEHRLERVTLDGQPVEPDLRWEGGEVFPVMKVNRGHHTLAMAYRQAAETEPVAIDDLQAEATPEGIQVSLPGYDRALLTIERDDRVLYNRMTEANDGIVVLPLAAARHEAGEHLVVLRAVVDGTGQVRLATSAPARVTLPAAAPDLGLAAEEKPATMPGKREIVDVQRTIKGLDVLRSAASYTESLRGSYQPDLEALVAGVHPDELLLEAGTTRKIENDVRGMTFAGLEIRNLRQVEVRLSNTFHDAHHARGKGFHVPHRPNSGNFAGIVVDYHTPEGYAKRVRHAVGVLHPKCSSVHPDYGKPGLADTILDLGSSLIETPEQTFALDLERHAPPAWDGQVWLSVGTDWVASDRRLTLQILAANQAVAGGFLEGADPKAFLEAYEKPRKLLVPRSPGGILIDGQTNEEWWKEAARTEQFFLHAGKGVSDADTTALLLYDDTHLYVAFICMEPARSKPLIIGGALWDDDEVEVWIDVNRDEKTFKQVIVNAANESLEYSEAGPTPIGARSAVFVDEGTSWSVEMTIPFAGLGIDPPKPGDDWRISLCRYRPPGEDFNSEMIVWAALKAGGFKDLENFGTLVFK